MPGRPPEYPKIPIETNQAVEYATAKTSRRNSRLKWKWPYTAAVLGAFSLVPYVWTLLYTDIAHLDVLGGDYDVTLIDGKIYVDRWPFESRSFSLHNEHRPFANDSAYIEKFDKETHGIFGFRYGSTSHGESIIGIPLLALPVLVIGAFLIVRRLCRGLKYRKPKS